MTSNVEYLNINPNFPEAGVDNDTQGFRDNFDAIRQSLRAAGEEITDLQDNVARTDQDVDYNLNKIQNAVLENVRDQRWNHGDINANQAFIDFTYGSYQILELKTGDGIDPFRLEFLNFPGDPTTQNRGVGKIILELSSFDTEPKSVAFQTSGNTVIKKNNFPQMPLGNTGDMIVSQLGPTFIEIWRWKEDTIYIKYMGIFQ